MSSKVVSIYKEFTNNFNYIELSLSFFGVFKNIYDKYFDTIFLYVTSKINITLLYYKKKY